MRWWMWGGLIVVFAVLIALGVMFPHTPPEDQASAYCQGWLAGVVDDDSEFDIVEWTNGNYRPDGYYTFTGRFLADQYTYEVSCQVTGEPGSFKLSSWDIDLVE